MTGKSIQFAAKAVLINRQKNLVIFNVTIFPSNLEKKKTQIKIYAFLNHFSICTTMVNKQSFFFDPKLAKPLFSLQHGTSPRYVSKMK